MLFTIAISIVLAFAMILNVFVETNVIAPVDLVIGLALFVRVLVLPDYNIELLKKSGWYSLPIIGLGGIITADRASLVDESSPIPADTLLVALYVLITLAILIVTNNLLSVETHNRFQDDLKQAIFALGVIVIIVMISYNPFNPVRIYPNEVRYLFFVLLQFVAQLVVIIGYAHVVYAIENYNGQLRDKVDPDELLYRRAYTEA